MKFLIFFLLSELLGPFKYSSILTLPAPLWMELDLMDFWQGEAQILFALKELASF